MSSQSLMLPVRTLKWALAAGTLAFVVAYFFQLLARLEETPVIARPWLLVASVATYVAGQFSSIACWRYLLRRLGHQPPDSAVGAAYFWGQFGKYIPGRVWALFYRASLLRRSGVPFRDGFYTAFLEGLLQALAGALLGIIFCCAVEVPSVPTMWIAIGLFSLMAVVATLIALVMGRFACDAKSGHVSRRCPIGPGDLFRAMALVAPIWVFHGLSLWLLLASILPDSAALDPGSVVRVFTAYVLSYSAGFAVVFIPNGLGVRELVMQQLLAAELARVGVENAPALAAVVTVAARLTFLAAEAVAASSFSTWFAIAPKSPTRATKRRPELPAALPHS